MGVITNAGHNLSLTVLVKEEAMSCINGSYNTISFRIIFKQQGYDNC